MPELIKIPCPNCKEKVITMIHRRSHLEFHSSHAASRTVKKPSYKKESYGILSSKCNNCEKPIEDLIPKLKKEGWL